MKEKQTQIEQKKNEVNTIGVLKLFSFSSTQDKLIILLGVICSIANGASQPLMTLIFGKIIGALASYPLDLKTDPEKAKANLNDSIKTLCLAFVYLAIATFFVAYLQLTSWMISVERQCVRIRSHYFKAITKQEQGWFDSESSGDLSSRISGDVNLIQDGISEKFGSYIQYVSTFITGFIIAYVKGWKLALVMTSAIPVIIACGALIGKFVAAKSASGQGSFGDSAAVAEEVFGAIKTVFAFGTEDKELKRYEQKIEEARQSGVKKGVIMGIGFGSIYFFLFLTYALGYWYGSRLILDKELDLSSVINVFFSIIIGAMSLGQTANSVSALSSAQGAALKIFTIIEKTSLINPLSEEGIKPSVIKGDIVFENVDFTYPTRKEVQILKNLNITIPAGKTVALVGSSGSGKSTIIQLIERFYDPQSGIIHLDGLNLKDYNVANLRKHIGIVGQEPILFATSIFQNVAWGSIKDEEPTLEEVISACKLANAHDFIMKLPKQYDTVVGDKGGLLSGGQKQRIAIARAIIKNPSILLLDEATSALDTSSERIVQSALDNAAQGRTTIIIAHRLSTIKNADIIYVMDKGVVVEQGDHQELLRLNSMYAGLVKAQELNRSENESSTETVNEKINESYDEEKEVEVKRIKTVEQILEDKKEELEKRPTPFLRVYNYAKDKKTLLGFAIFGTLIDGAILPTYSVLFTNIIQKLSLTDQPDELRRGVNFWASMFLVIASIAFFAQLSRHGLFEMVGQSITKKVRYESFRALLKQDMSFFDKEENSIGILSAKLSTEADQVKSLVTDVLTMGFASLSATGVAFGLAFAYGWKLALVVIACLPAMVIAATMQNKVFQGYSLKIKKAYEKSAEIASESVLNIRTVASLAREKTFHHIYEERNTNPHKLAIKSALYGGIGFGLSQSLTFLFNATGFYYGSRLILNDGYSIQDMIQTLTAIMFLGILLGQNSQYARNFSKAKISAIEFFDLIDKEPKIQSPSSGGQIKEVEGNCEAEEVQFSYPTRSEISILNNLNLRLPASKSIALVGTSGCGKSTLLALLQRLYDTDGGNVTVEGLNVKEWNLEKLRSSMSIVGQEPVLFDYTIAENISYGKSDATHDQIVEAAKLANAHNFIMNFPDGYQTRVGERGGQMSGGQKQRIAIARALIRNPKLLLLDEATSALDSESEKVVQEALDNASKGRTSISIAHRLSTIQNSDLIVVMKDGKVVELGKHQELLDMKGLYNELANQQDLN